VAVIRSQPAEICGSKRPSGAHGSASNRSRPMQVTRNTEIKSLQTMRMTIKENSSPTTATSSGRDIQAQVCQLEGDITATIRPRGEANVGPTKAVQPPAQPIRRPRTPAPGLARHPRVPTATQTCVKRMWRRSVKEFSSEPVTVRGYFIICKRISKQWRKTVPGLTGEWVGSGTCGRIERDVQRSPI